MRGELTSRICRRSWRIKYRQMMITLSSKLFNLNTGSRLPRPCTSDIMHGHKINATTIDYAPLSVYTPTRHVHFSTMAISPRSLVLVVSFKWAVTAACCASPMLIRHPGLSEVNIDMNNVMSLTQCRKSWRFIMERVTVVVALDD